MKKSLKKSLLLCMLLSFIFTLAGCEKNEDLFFEVNRESMIKTTKNIISVYYDTDDTEQEYFLNDGTELEKTAVSGFLAAQTTDRVGKFMSFRDDSTAEITNGANGKVNCSILCKYEHRDVKVTVSYTQNRKFDLDAAAFKDNLNNQAAQYGVDAETLITQSYANDDRFDVSSVDAFVESFLALQYNEMRYNPEECEVSAVYSKRELISQAGKNTIIGMGVVFAVLIFISFIISLLKYLPMLFDADIRKQRAEKKAAEEAAKKKTEESIIGSKASEESEKTEVAADKPAASASENLVNDSELVAVITAAIYAASGSGVRGPACTASNDKLVVRSIRRVR
ncbi:MAG: OadG family protein [Eubacterium sp.]|nr:OadG family protein [Eubacterium sp.]